MPAVWNEQSYQVSLSKSSQLIIQGSTNINQFQCKYSQPLHPEVLTVNARQLSDGLYFSNAILKLQSKNFRSINPHLNRDMQVLLKSAQHPNIIIHLLKAELPKSIALNPIQADVEITLAGVSRRYMIPVLLSNQGEEHSVSGRLLLNICDFDLEPPTVLKGLIIVNQEVKINFNLNVCIENYNPTTSSAL
jgi:hypothetical protein